MDEKTILAWFESLEQRFTETVASKTGEDDVWSAIYTEMRAALEMAFPPSHVVVRKWEDAVARAKKIDSGNRVEVPERWVRDELIGVFRTATSLLKADTLEASSMASGQRLSRNVSIKQRSSPGRAVQLPRWCSPEVR